MAACETGLEDGVWKFDHGADSRVGAAASDQLSLAGTNGFSTDRSSGAAEETFTYIVDAAAYEIEQGEDSLDVVFVCESGEAEYINRLLPDFLPDFDGCDEFIK